ncbi:MAG: hypothetical protein ACE5L7_09560, partial [Candidatus Aminicenantales bacterium]
FDQFLELFDDDVFTLNQSFDLLIIKIRFELGLDMLSIQYKELFIELLGAAADSTAGDELRHRGEGHVEVYSTDFPVLEVDEDVSRVKALLFMDEVFKDVDDFQRILETFWIRGF